MRRPGWGAGSPALPTLVLIAFAALACEERAEDEIRPPDIAEVEVEPGEVEFEAAFPLEPDDIGDVMLATGTVVGVPGPHGFFLKGEGAELIFVEVDSAVFAGQRVRAVGPLAAADAAVFVGWEADLLSDPDPLWAVVRGYYIDATRVEPL